MTPRLYRSRTDAMLGGVCGGIARYLGVDVTLVRLVAVLLVLGNGIGVLPYLLLWIIVPLEPLADADARPAGAALGSNPRAWTIVGLALLVVGALSLLDQVNLRWFHWFEWDMVWPVVLIIGGAALLWRRSHPVDKGV